MKLRKDYSSEGYFLFGNSYSNYHSLLSILCLL
jgi:hypothetical protein